MKTDALKSCKSYIECQFHRREPAPGEPVKPFVTISRQAGAGGITIGRLLGEFLRGHDKAARCACPWTVFDKNLVAEVVKSHNLPERLREYLSEESISDIEDTLGELFRLHPAKWTLVQKTSQTILNLAKVGHVILVGRGANVVTRALEGGFHVRLIGSPEKRLKHLVEYYGFSGRRAQEFMKAEDEGRKRYLKDYFGKNIDDPLLYDLVVNTDSLPYAEVAHLIGRAVLAQNHGERLLRSGARRRAASKDRSTSPAY